MGKGVACVAVIGTCWRTTSLVPIPVGVATTVPPTNGWVVFDQSEHGELPAYGTLFKNVAGQIEKVSHHLSFSSSVSVKKRISRFLSKRRRNERSTQ